MFKLMSLLHSISKLVNIIFQLFMFEPGHYNHISDFSEIKKRSKINFMKNEGSKRILHLTIFNSSI